MVESLLVETRLFKCPELGSAGRPLRHGHSARFGRPVLHPHPGKRPVHSTGGRAVVPHSAGDVVRQGQTGGHQKDPLEAPPSKCSRRIVHRCASFLSSSAIAVERV
jgi:hypothetical protein